MGSCAKSHICGDLFQLQSTHYRLKIFTRRNEPGNHTVTTDEKRNDKHRAIFSSLWMFFITVFFFFFGSQGYSLQFCHVIPSFNVSVWVFLSFRWIFFVNLLQLQCFRPHIHTGMREWKENGQNNHNYVYKIFALVLAVVKYSNHSAFIFLSPQSDSEIGIEPKTTIWKVCYFFPLFVSPFPNDCT